MSASRSDLTAYARIRVAALAMFADQGATATSIRDVASAAGVSPGLVQHYFGTKSGLRDAVNEHVIALARAEFEDLPTDGDPTEIQQQMGDAVTRFVRDNPTALRYVARAVADQDGPALQIFDAFVAISRTQWQRLADHQLVRADADLEWAALHVVLFNLATVLMRDAIDRHLPAPFDLPDQLERWNQATNDLFYRGLYDPSGERRAERE
jgi:TetR/AcrR family transcriptional regulator, regulator of cefoperazone and chloramphenicol sensitivity